MNPVTRDAFPIDKFDICPTTYIIKNPDSYIYNSIELCSVVEYHIINMIIRNPELKQLPPSELIKIIMSNGRGLHMFIAPSESYISDILLKIDKTMILPDLQYDDYSSDKYLNWGPAFIQFIETIKKDGIIDYTKFIDDKKGTFTQCIRLIQHYINAYNLYDKSSPGHSQFILNPTLGKLFGMARGTVMIIADLPVCITKNVFVNGD